MTFYECSLCGQRTQELTETKNIEGLWAYCEHCNILFPADSPVVVEEDNSVSSLLKQVIELRQINQELLKELEKQKTLRPRTNIIQTAIERQKELLRLNREKTTSL